MAAPTAPVDEERQERRSLSSLPALLGRSITLRNFERDHWQQKPLKVEQKNMALTQLLTPKHFWAVVNLLNEKHAAATAQTGAKLASIAGSSAHDFTRGRSIIVNRIDLVHPPIARLCQALRAHLHHVFAVCYCTPRGTQAVPPHSDDQDVFILQVAGRKRWLVYDSQILLPYSHEQIGKRGLQLDVSSLGPPVLETVLGEGQLLYIPRGAIHQAMADKDVSSLHITLTVQTSDLTCGQFVLAALEQLLSAHDEFRQALPPRFSSDLTPETLEPLHFSKGSLAERWDKLRRFVSNHINNEQDGASNACDLALEHIRDKLQLLNEEQDEACSVTSKHSFLHELTAREPQQRRRFSSDDFHSLSENELLPCFASSVGRIRRLFELVSDIELDIDNIPGSLDAFERFAFIEYLGLATRSQDLAHMS